MRQVMAGGRRVSTFLTAIHMVCEGMRLISGREKFRSILSVFVTILCLTGARVGLGQSTPVSGYPTLVAALNAGTTVITNFQVNSFATPISISLATNQTIQITNNVIIDAGSNFVVFQGNGLGRLFYVHPSATLTLNNVELTGGTSTNGGAIFNAGTLIISNSLLTGNYASNTSGTSGLAANPSLNGNGTNGGSGGTSYGGAIYSTGSLFLSYAVLSNNVSKAGSGGDGSAAGGGVGNGGSAGYGGNAFGGAIFATGATNSFYMTEFIGNQSTAGTGGTGGSYATNTIPAQGSGGAAGVGGYGAGGAVYIAGSLVMTNCIFYDNFAEGGGSGAAEVDYGSSGADGSSGGSAFGGALFITNGVPTALVDNTIFYYNACYGGPGGSTTLNAATGGDGGFARGAGIWSGAQSLHLSFCTLATNYLVGGVGGSNYDSGFGGTTGNTAGPDIFGAVGVTALADSLLSGNNLTNLPNVYGVTDLGYNLSSDSSLVKNTYNPTTLLNVADLNFYFTSYGVVVGGGSYGSTIDTLEILSNSPAGKFVPGVPGLTFSATDETLTARSTPTSAGAWELNPIFNLTNNLALPTIISTLPGTNFTGAGGSASFTATTTTQTNTNTLSYGYQWQLNGTNIFNGANYTGATSNVLDIRNITIADEGIYTLIISPTLLEDAITNLPGVELILTNPPVVQSEPVSLYGRPSGSVVRFEIGVASPLNFNYQWFFDGTNLPDRSEYSGTNSNILTIDPATAIDAGTYSVIVSNSYGVRKSEPVVLTIVADHVHPVATITSPIGGARTNTVILSGTAVDNAQIAEVNFWLTNINAGLTPSTNVMSGQAVLSTNSITNLNGGDQLTWSITNSPLPGTNILAVQAVDYSSNVSGVLTRRFFYEVPSVLTLLTNTTGSGGTLVGHAFYAGDAAPSNTASLNIGESYNIIAHPNANALLGNWTNISGSNIKITNGTILRFTMESNTVIYATFVTNIYPEFTGVYNGLFYVTNESTTNVISSNGVAVPYYPTNPAPTNVTFTTNTVISSGVTFASSGKLANLVIGRDGNFSGTLLIAGSSFPLAGTFDAFGHLTNYFINRAEIRGGPLLVNLELNSNNLSFITGYVSDTNWPAVATLWGYRSTPVKVSSRYTAILAPSQDVVDDSVTPGGDGYALLGDQNGVITVTGGLADGTAFSEIVPASISNDVPVYASLYGHTGVLFGWLNLNNIGNSNSVNNLYWIKQPSANPNTLFAGGFTNLLQTQGSVWVRPDSINASNGSFLLISNSSINLDYTVTITNNDRIINVSSVTNSLAGTVNLANGLLQLTFNDGSGLVHGVGALLQDTNIAGGYFVTKAETGLIYLNGVGGTFIAPETEGESTGDNTGSSTSLIIAPIQPAPYLPPGLINEINNPTQ